MSLSKIEWTDATWNPLRGCRKISPGCKHCYAEAFAERFRGVPEHPYEAGFDPRLVPEKLSEPLRWRDPRVVFVNSMSDLFFDTVPDDYIVEVAKVMAAANWHTYQVLTKRADRMRDLMGTLGYAHMSSNEDETSLMTATQRATAEPINSAALALFRLIGNVARYNSVDCQSEADDVATVFDDAATEP